MGTRYKSNGTQWVAQAAADTKFIRGLSGWTPLGDGPGNGGPSTPPADPDALTALPTAGLIFRTRAADPAGTGAAPVEGAPVTTLRDTVGNKSFTISNKADGTPYVETAPTYRSGGGTPHLRFNGQIQKLSYPGPVLPSTGAFTIYSVLRVGRRGYGSLFWQGSTTSAIPFYGLDCVNAGQLRAVRRTDDNVLVSSAGYFEPNAWSVTSAVSQGVQHASLRLQEVDAAIGSTSTDTAGVTTTDATSIGARVSFRAADLGKYGMNFTGDVAEIVIYTGAHDAATRSKIEKYLATLNKVRLPSQGGALDLAAIVADQRLWSQEYGIPAVHAVTGKALPGFHNTGPAPGTVYTNYTGTFTTTSVNQVVENMRITGGVRVLHEGAKFRNCQIYSTSDPKADTRTDVPLVNVPIFEDCEIFGQLNDSGTAVGYIRYTAIRCFVHDAEDEFRLNKQTRIIDCLAAVHSDGYLTTSERLHTDCVQSNGGDNDPGVWSEVIGCTLIAQRHNGTKGNSAVILATEGAMVAGVNQGSPLRNVRIEGNYLAGGSYTLYIKTPGTSGSPGPMENFLIKDNVFRGKGEGGRFAQYGSVWLPKASIADLFVTMTGNLEEVYDANGTLTGTTATLTIDRSTSDPGGTGDAGV